MQMKLRMMRSIMLVLMLAFATAWTGCIHRAPRYYDSYYNDYHKWNDSEVDHYHQWTHETHRDPDIEFRKLSQDEQEDYWKWRHTHENQGHHHKHDNS
jgi:hypothetical protein